MMKPRRAFTLVEMIAAIVVIGLVAGTATVIITESADAYAASSASRSDADDAAFALHRITAAIKAVEQHPTLPGTPHLSYIAPSEFRTAAGLRVRLHRSNLRLTEPGRREAILAAGVTAFDITYLDGDNNILNPSLPHSLLLVRRLAIRLVLHDQEFRGIVTPRAVMDWRGQ